ncbi:MAG: ATP-binding cassette domain-containing protein [Flavobacteriales bacterium]
MQVFLQQASKRFEGRSILQNINFELEPGDRTLISGPNGAGKSTLLKLIAAFLRPSEGKVLHYMKEAPIEPEKVYQYVALAAPYLQFPQDMSVQETILTWSRFRSLKVEVSKIPSMVHLEGTEQRPLRELSSGMGQRLRLGIAFMSDTPLLLLDEPLSNIDQEGRHLYHQLLEREGPDRTILVCSNNVEQEAPSQHQRFHIENRELHPLN